ncbi:MAG: wax ester/triacylglycerol synthase domain-containing protein [Acidimicrobiia bacterium]
MVEPPDPHMRESDAFSWYMERDPLLRSTVVAVMTFDRAPDHRLVLARLERASRIVPGLRHHLVEPPLRLAPPRWVVDASFDLSWHVRRVEAPTPKDMATVLELARKEGMEGFDTARPLWSWTTVEGLEFGRAAAILKVHHALTDGIGGMQLTAELFDFERGAPEPDTGPEAPPSENPGRAQLALEAIGYDAARVVGFTRRGILAAPRVVARALRHPASTAVDALRTGRSIVRTVQPIADTYSPVMQHRALGWHYAALDLQLDDLKRAARVAHGTLNDAFLAGIADALHRYHARHGAEVPELRVTMPISIRKDDDPAGGNRITLMRFSVPVGAQDPETRIRVLHDRAAACRDEPSIPLTNMIAGVLNLLPNGVVGSMLKHVDFLASNVPGLDAPIYVGRARVLGLYPFGPTIGAALNVTLLSYCGTCNVGVNTDTGAVPDPDALVECLREGFEEILDLGGPHEPVRSPAA